MRRAIPMHRLPAGVRAVHAIAAAGDEDLTAPWAATMTTKPASFVAPPQEDGLFASRGAVERLRLGGHKDLAADLAGPLVAAGVVAALGTRLGNLLLSNSVFRTTFVLVDHVAASPSFPESSIFRPRACDAPRGIRDRSQKRKGLATTPGCSFADSHLRMDRLKTAFRLPSKSAFAR